MKALFFDCSSGISGNMVLGALIEIIGDESYLISELKKVHVTGYHLNISKTVKNDITGTYVDVHLDYEHNHEHSHEHEHNYEHSHEHSHEHEHNHDHSHEHKHNHDHNHRNLYDIYKIIDDSHIDLEAKVLAKKIFMRVAVAESKVHNESLENVHFHEVGAVDSIIDIIGTAILITKINPDIIYSSIINDGYGFIECAHGIISVPVPATSEIFASSQVLSRQIDIDTELVTPTGAAIIAELASSYGNMPTMNVQKIGWGAGTKNLKIPNLVKVSLGEITAENQSILVLETNIDDCSGELLGNVIEKLMCNGALDAFLTPIYMKKNRPAYCLSVLCEEENLNKIQDIIFEETTTIGIRYHREERKILDREKSVITTKYGEIEVKKVKHNNNFYIYPEFESVKKLAEEKDIPLKLILKEI